MKTSELIVVLQGKLETHGDLEVDGGDDPFLCIDVEGLDKGTQAVDPSEGEPS